MQNIDTLHIEISQKQALLETHKRSLHELEEQAAKFGLYTPAYISIDIEDHKKKIEILGEQILELENKRNSLQTNVPEEALADRTGSQEQSSVGFPKAEDTLSMSHSPNPPNNSGATQLGCGGRLIIVFILAFIIYGVYSFWQDNTTRKETGTVIRVDFQTETSPICTSLAGCYTYKTDVICYVNFQYDDGKTENLEVYRESFQSYSGKVENPAATCQNTQKVFTTNKRFHIGIKGNKVTNYIEILQ